MIKFCTRFALAAAFFAGCGHKPFIRTETDVLSSLARSKIATFSAQGTVAYYGSREYRGADFRCSVRGTLFRFTITGPLGMVLGDVVNFGDSLYLYDARNGVVMIGAPDQSLKELTGVEVVPTELAHALVGNLPDFESLKDFRQENGTIILEFPGRRYYYQSKNLALVRIEQPKATVEFRDFIATTAGPRPTFIRLVQGNERVDITLRQQTVNRPLADATFQFHVPGGIEVIDVR